MTEDEKFYTTAENKCKEHWIAFPTLPNDTDGEEPIKTNVQTVTLNKDTLKDFENQVNDPAVRGCSIGVEKLVPVGGEDTSKGKPPAKGKPVAPTGDEPKPVFGEAWFDLVPFLHPGATESIQRCFIKTVRPVKEDGHDGTENSQHPGEGEASHEPNHIFEDRHAYVIVKLTLSEAINPAIDPGALPRSTDIARNAVNNMPQGFPTVFDAVLDYQHSVIAIVNEISIEYQRMFQGEEENNVSALGITGQHGAVKSQQGNLNHQREMRE
jgi:hypothetical protein